MYWKNCAIQMSLSTTHPKWTGLNVLEKQLCYPNDSLSTADPKWNGPNYWKNNSAIQMSVYLPQIQSGLD